MVCECKGMYCKNISNDHLRIAKKTLMFYKAIKKTFICVLASELRQCLTSLHWFGERTTIHQQSQKFTKDSFFIYICIFLSVRILEYLNTLALKQQNINVTIMSNISFYNIWDQIIKSSSFYFG